MKSSLEIEGNNETHFSELILVHAQNKIELNIYLCTESPGQWT